jgi:predicted amidophosphoribosyltransferase
MICLACRSFSAEPVCQPCRSRLRPAPDRWIRAPGGGVVVRAAFAHEGTARLLVHRLKYEGVAVAAALLASAMAPHVRGAALVPVPRTTWRRQRYGVDPAVELARVLAGLTGVPVLFLLRPALVGPTHAGRSRHRRRPPGFRLVGAAPPEAVLIDDVVTTGVTLASAAAALGLAGVSALTATSRDVGAQVGVGAGRNTPMTSLFGRG